MKRIITGFLAVFVSVMGIFPVNGFAQDPQDSAVTKVGSLRSRVYIDVCVSGNYAYCVVPESGVDIIDLGDPSNPREVGFYEISGDIYSIAGSGSEIFLACGSGGLMIVDVSTPQSPLLKSTYNSSGFIYGVFIRGVYAYLWGSESSEFKSANKYFFQIIDISDPATPILAANKFTNGEVLDLYVSGNFIYTVGSSGLEIFDASNPNSPFLVGSLEIEDYLTKVFVRDNYVFTTKLIFGSEFNYYYFCVIDAADPTSPSLIGTYNSRAYEIVTDMELIGNYAYVLDDFYVEVFDISDPLNVKKITYYKTYYVYGGSLLNTNYYVLAAGRNGLKVIDISNPAEPSLAGQYDGAFLLWDGVFAVKNNYVYLSDDNTNIAIVDISTPTVPVWVGNYKINTLVDAFYINGNYLYSGGYYGLKVLDISNPLSLKEVANLHTDGTINAIYVKNGFLYTTSCYFNELNIYDVADPTIPVFVGGLDTWVWGLDTGFSDVKVLGNTAYAASTDGLRTVDISEPSTPTLMGHYQTPKSVTTLDIKGNYAYLAVNHTGLHIVNVSDPSAPVYVGDVETDGVPTGIFLQGDYAYVVYLQTGLKIFNIGTPSAPYLAATYDYIDQSGWDGTKVYVRGGYIYVTSLSEFSILTFDPTAAKPQIVIDRPGLFYNADSNGNQTSAQSFFIGNGGVGYLNWSISVDRDWLNCSPTSGTNSGEVQVSVDAAGLAPGTYNGTITISDANAGNSPQTVTVTLNVYPFGQTAVPFGEFATPTHGATVMSSVPVTGWVLDDIGLQSVQIFREENGSLVYIGDAVFVEGARPDVEQAYPEYPMNHKAGWGYMMLTNFLPNNGNGIFNIRAIATDTEGNQVTLGTKTIICDNANAVNPFGAIDTPTQGGTASGTQFINWGWVLTPLPNRIPIDGSTIDVWVDGVNVGHPTYNNYRADIADLFPDYVNSDGAVGYFYLDTTAYENGVHTIQWTAADDAGNIDGIGSRYFTIRNSTQDAKSTVRNEGIRRGGPLWPPISDGTIPIDYSTPVRIKKGYNKNIEPQIKYPDENGTVSIEIKELERLEIHLFDPGESTLSLEHRTSNISSLPIGSTLDARRGVFFWQPGVGFVGEYRFVFIATDHTGNQTRKNIVVNIKPRFSKEGVALPTQKGPAGHLDGFLK
jgi:hypothetical protein